MRKNRADMRRRVARLRLPEAQIAALRAELEALDRRYPELSEEQIAALSDEELDELFTLFTAETGPFARRDELVELLKTPQQRAEDARYRAWLDTLTREELDQALCGELEPPFATDES